MLHRSDHPLKVQIPGEDRLHVRRCGFYGSAVRSTGLRLSAGESQVQLRATAPGWALSSVHQAALVFGGKFQPGSFTPVDAHIFTLEN